MAVMPSYSCFFVGLEVAVGFNFVFKNFTLSSSHQHLVVVKASMLNVE
jgi:hypothetical protein